MTADHTVALLLDLAFVFVLSRLLGRLARRFDQPAVIGEIIAGIVVGPTLFHGAITTVLFPTAVRPLLSGFANLGVLLFMFTVGLELDRRLLRGTSRTIAWVSVGSVIPSFGFGLLLARALRSSQPTSHTAAFILFLGLAMSVTALPVLARILYDRRIGRTAVGHLAVSCAAVGDVLAWSLLAVVTLLAGEHTQQWRFLVVPPFVLALFLARPLLRRLMAKAEADDSTAGLFAVVLVGLLVSGAVTQWVGMHFIFGAFLFGLLLPKDNYDAVRAEILRSVQRMGITLLMPVYFVIAGLQVDLSKIDNRDLAWFGLIMLVAMGGKFGGVFAAARSLSIRPRQAAALATLLNTRGLTELVILSVGLQAGLLDQELYSLMVLMTVVTTSLAGPLLRLFCPDDSVLNDLGPRHELPTTDLATSRT
jgi:Kef-type K+ transport system membrane component KefB